MGPHALVHQVISTVTPSPGCRHRALQRRQFDPRRSREFRLPPFEHIPELVPARLMQVAKRDQLIVRKPAPQQLNGPPGILFPILSAAACSCRRRSSSGSRSAFT